ncbi:unnamed protein product [Durusdinium trenchii]|uniref:Ricin B lectin domain-containing protein n=1 Tax=Durusdinium trenchii TaxID=1381693 RepID=A0ABP0J2T5_9DINO
MASVARTVGLLTFFCAAEASLRSISHVRGRERRSASEEFPIHLAWSPTPNFCVSADRNRLANGVKVQLWECDNTWQSKGQNFVVDSQHRIRMHTNLDYCLVVDGDYLATGAKIQLWKCNEENPNQQWYSNLRSPISSLSKPSVCMAVDGNTAYNGAAVQLAPCQGPNALQEWTRLALGPGGRVFAVPNADGACEAPFSAVDASSEACVEAAEALRPDKGCYSRSWKSMISTEKRRSWPKGCYFYSACGGGCGLYLDGARHFNPSGQGQHCPVEGDCISISVICQQTEGPVW